MEEQLSHLTEYCFLRSKFASFLNLDDFINISRLHNTCLTVTNNIPISVHLHEQFLFLAIQPEQTKPSQCKFIK